MRTDWRDISYLKDGTARQRDAYRTLVDYRLLADLADFDPLLASTVNIDIDIPGSDLDIICEVRDKDHFTRVTQQLFSHLPSFNARSKPFKENEATVVQFTCPLFDIELFGAAIPVEEQDAFKHLETFERVIRLGGDQLKTEIRRLKTSGLKTEPAFAELFGFDGDPYEAVFQLNALSDEELIRRCTEVMGPL